MLQGLCCSEPLAWIEYQHLVNEVKPVCCESLIDTGAIFDTIYEMVLGKLATQVLLQSTMAAVVTYKGLEVAKAATTRHRLFIR